MKEGFSLVELSIVLVILGLLTGGILAGQSLIRAAEIRSISTDFDRYNAAFYTFRDKYFAIPGDMRNATKFWGAQTGVTTDGVVTACVNLTTAATSVATCNGDGDGLIHTVDSGTTYHERHRSWQHLANAGLIEGTYSGIAGTSAAAHVVIGENAPRSKISDAGFSMMYMQSQTTASTNWFPGSYGNVLFFGSEGTSTNWGAAITPEEA